MHTRNKNTILTDWNIDPFSLGQNWPPNFYQERDLYGSDLRLDICSINWAKQLPKISTVPRSWSNTRSIFLTYHFILGFWSFINMRLGRILFLFGMSLQGKDLLSICLKVRNVIGKGKNTKAMPGLKTRSFPILAGHSTDWATHLPIEPERLYCYCYEAKRSGPDLAVNYLCTMYKLLDTCKIYTQVWTYWSVS